MNKTIDVMEALDERRVERAMPVLEAPESLNAENVAAALSKAKNKKKTYLSKYAGIAVAALLVLTIGLGMGIGRERLKEAAPEMDMAVNEGEVLESDGVPQTEDHPSFGSIQTKGDEETVTVMYGGVTYIGYPADAVPFDGEGMEMLQGTLSQDVKDWLKESQDLYGTDSLSPSGDVLLARDTGTQTLYLVFTGSDGTEMMIPLEEEGMR